jgi:uncharacterized protein (DUF433 family)
MMSTQTSEIVLTGPNGEALVRKTPDVCGGDACIRETRIMVWLLVDIMNAGISDPEILEGYPTLTARDLDSAREYYRLHAEEIDNLIASQELDD